jgi:hypothetical protein
MEVDKENDSERTGLDFSVNKVLSIMLVKV